MEQIKKYIMPALPARLPPLRKHTSAHNIDGGRGLAERKKKLPKKKTPAPNIDAGRGLAARAPLLTHTLHLHRHLHAACCFLRSLAEKRRLRLPRQPETAAHRPSLLCRESTAAACRRTASVPRNVAYVSIRQLPPAYVSIRQHTSAYASILGLSASVPRHAAP
jgi:hypothetical protein